MQGEVNGHLPDADFEGMIKEAEGLAEKASERYREKAFGIFLSMMCNQTSTKRHADNGGNTSGFNPKLTNEVKSFMKRRKITDAQIKDCLSISETGEIGVICRSKKRSRIEFQMQTACIKALEDALNGGRLEFSSKDVREICKSTGMYHNRHFLAYFRKRKDWFQSLKNMDQILLSEKGEKILADIINEHSPLE